MTNLFENNDPWQDRLSEYLDGLLAEPEKRALEEHLRTCESCRTALVELRAVVERLRADPMDAIPEGAWPRIASRLSMSQLPSYRGSRERVRRSTRGLQAATLRRITTAASLVLTLAGGIWVGASLCIAGMVWTAPGWMHLPGAVDRPFDRLPSTRAVPTNATDSIVDAWTPLRRSLAALDQQIADASRALRREPGNQALRHVVQQLARERNNIQAMLDSVTARH
jgi:anti-sigma factor RsiW